MTHSYTVQNRKTHGAKFSFLFTKDLQVSEGLLA